MAATLMRPVASLIEWLGQSGPASIYPFPLFMFFHAARISTVFRSRVRQNGTGGQLAWPADLAGFFLFAWGGQIISNVLLNQIPNQVISPWPWVAYGLVHVALSTIFALLPDLPTSYPLAELVFWPVMDAATRSGAIIGGVMLVKSHSNPAVSSSLFTQILIGALSASGGGLLASTLGVWNTNWGLSTPPALKSGSSFIPSLDIWSGAMAAAIYGALTRTHPSYDLVYTSFGQKPQQLVTSLGARSVFTIFLALMYFMRTALALGLAKSAPRIQKGVLKPAKPVTQNKKSQ